MNVWEDSTYYSVFIDKNFTAEKYLNMFKDEVVRAMACLYLIISHGYKFVEKRFSLSYMFVVQTEIIQLKLEMDFVHLNFIGKEQLRIIINR